MKFPALLDMTPFRLVVNDVSEDFFVFFSGFKFRIIFFLTDGLLTSQEGFDVWMCLVVNQY